MPQNALELVTSKLNKNTTTRKLTSATQERIIIKTLKEQTYAYQNNTYEQF